MNSPLYFLALFAATPFTPALAAEPVQYTAPRLFMAVPQPTFTTCTYSSVRAAVSLGLVSPSPQALTQAGCSVRSVLGYLFRLEADGVTVRTATGWTLKGHSK